MLALDREYLIQVREPHAASGWQKLDSLRMPCDSGVHAEQRRIAPGDYNGDGVLEVAVADPSSPCDASATGWYGVVQWPEPLAEWPGFTGVSICWRFALRYMSLGARTMLRRRSLHGAAWLDLDPEFLDMDQACALQQTLQEQLPWQQKPIVVFGREVLQPRLVSWAGELPYRYSGQTLPPLPMPPVLAELRDQMQALTGVPFNHVLLNRYRDGRDYMSSHADNEPELGHCPVIAAVSLGAERSFRLTPKWPRDKKLQRRRRFSVMLSHGSLLIMGGRMQHTWRHEVPRSLRVESERINLTFRWLKGPPGWRVPR